MKAIDLFCGASGASVGLHRAGYEVVGVDHRPQPRYPFAFIQADALNPPVRLEDFDFIWASPPCQEWVPLKSLHPTTNHPNHIPATRSLLHASRRAWVIENSPRAPLRRDLLLSGDMFALNTYRRRAFELSFFMLAPRPGRPFGPKTRPGAVLVVGASGGSSRRDGWSNGNHDSWAAAMGIDWMTNEEMAQAVPPIYSEYIAREWLRQRRAAA